MAEPHCPFYGMNLVITENVKLMIESKVESNRCGLYDRDHRPCKMEAFGKVPEVKQCPVYVSDGQGLMNKLRGVAVLTKDMESMTIEEWIRRFL